MNLRLFALVPLAAFALAQPQPRSAAASLSRHLWCLWLWQRKAAATG